MSLTPYFVLDKIKPKEADVFTLIPGRRQNYKTMMPRHTTPHTAHTPPQTARCCTAIAAMHVRTSNTAVLDGHIVYPW